MKTDETMKTDAPGARRETIGHRYVREYLDAEDVGDSMWIAESIDNGEITACPRCQFLHLPARPFALMGYLGNDDNGQPETVQETACDVCAILPAYTRRAFGGFQREQESLDKARENLRDSRTMRARALYDLWIGACSAADWLCWAIMADSLDALRERVTGTEAAPEEGGIRQGLSGGITGRRGKPPGPADLPR